MTTVPDTQVLGAETLEDPEARHWVLSRRLRPEEVTAIFSRAS